MRFFSRIIFLVFILSLFFTSNFLVEAQAPTVTQLYGAIWSSNIGWISLNNCDVLQNGDLDCNGPEYHVEVGDITGAMSGAAWSSNIGWIKFGGLSGFPSGDGTVSENAEIDFSNGKVTGWIRACAGTESGDCSSMTSRADGWDGWISLSGALHPSPQLIGTGGITFNSLMNKLVGAAWGSEVVGWIKFQDVRYGAIPPAIVPVEYNLSNQVLTPQIAQGAIGHVSVTREWIAEGPDDVILDAPSSLNNGKINISISSNNPCIEPLGQEYPECTSEIIINVGASADRASYSFVVSGDPESAGAGIDETTINFEVIEPEPLPDFTCEASGNPWLYETITWTLDSEEFDGSEEFYWRHSGEDVSACNIAPTEECQISYTTVGTKVAEISLNGQDGPYVDCEPVNIGAQVFFKEI